MTPLELIFLIFLAAGIDVAAFLVVLMLLGYSIVLSIEAE
jgi:hypothetical protein